MSEKILQNKARKSMYTKNSFSSKLYSNTENNGWIPFNCWFYNKANA